jgi:hypothetical protein
VGHEEGFSYHKWESDFGPSTQALFAEWQQKTGKTAWKAFKPAVVKWWWKQFTTAFHEEDAYKVTSFNLAGGEPEAGREWMIDREGVDSTTYGEANLDVIGTMFYHKHGEEIWPNLDQHYDYLYDLPTLVSSEIGIGHWGPKAQFQEYVTRPWTVRVEVTAGRSGRYSIETWREGEAGPPEEKTLGQA